MTAKRNTAPVTPLALVTQGLDLARQTWATPWEWGETMIQLLGHPKPHEKGIRKRIEDFRQAVMEAHTERDGIEALDESSLPPAYKLNKYRKMAAAFPESQRSGLTMEAALELMHHVADPEMRGELITSMLSQGKTLTRWSMWSELSIRGLRTSQPEINKFRVGESRIRDITHVAGSIKLLRDDLKARESRQLAAELEETIGFLQGVAAYMREVGSHAKKAA